MSINSIDNAANHFLFVAHPGHELRVYGWLAAIRPRVFVLTDGSGHGGESRIASTTKLIESVGAKPGAIYARFKDADLYRLIVEHDFRPLLRVVDEFAEAIVAENVNGVVGDASEGYNPAHDACRLIINAAVRIARCHSGRDIRNREFLLVGPHTAATAEDISLDDAAFARKLQAAQAFPELQPEVSAILSGGLLALREYPQLAESSTVLDPGADDARIESLRPVDESSSGSDLPSTVPFYEGYGELRVADGYYRHVIRYREHMLPLAQALAKHAAGGGCP